MPAGTAFSRAIDSLVRDLTRLAEVVISEEVTRAFERATPRSAKAAPKRPRRSPEDRGEVVRLKAEEREQRKQARQAERQQRKEELARLKQERAALRTAAKEARLEAKEQLKRDKLAQREAEVKAREDARQAALAPPPVVVFKRARDGQVTVLKPRPVAAAAAEGTPPPVG
jgi:flagellar motility protein MotE (MotC chaperone)